jgi:hypothetical protein
MSAIENCAVGRPPIGAALENIKAIAHAAPAPTWLFTLAAAAGAAAMAAIFGVHQPESSGAHPGQRSSPGVAGNRPSEEDRPRKWHLLKGAPTVSNSNILGRLVVHGKQSNH